MTVGLLGLQGAFLDHIPHLKRLGAAYRIVRDAAALSEIDRLILPGGESTVMKKFLDAFDMTVPLKDETPVSTSTVLGDPSYNSSALRITSYNVCYTKLLRSIRGQIKSPQGSGTSGHKFSGVAQSLCRDFKI